jgi:hypothetical protein
VQVLDWSFVKLWVKSINDTKEDITQITIEDCLIDLSTSLYSLQASKLHEGYIIGVNLYRTNPHKDLKEWMMKSLKREHKQAKQLLAEHKQELDPTARKALRLMIKLNPNKIKLGKMS